MWKREVQQAKRSRNKEKEEENQKKPKSSKALSAGCAQRARRQGAKRTTRAEREASRSASLRRPKPKFAPINKRVSLGKRTHFLRAQFSNFWHSVLSFSFLFLIFLLPFCLPPACSSSLMFCLYVGFGFLLCCFAFAFCLVFLLVVLPLLLRFVFVLDW